MARMIKMYILSRNGLELKELDLEEAERILKGTYPDPLGGFVTDGGTGEVI